MRLSMDESSILPLNSPINSTNLLTPAFGNALEIDARSPRSPLRLSDSPDHRERFAFAHRRGAEDVQYFAGEGRAQFINPGAEEVGDVAHQRALDHGVTFLDQRIEDSGLVASEHLAAIKIGRAHV